MTRIVAGEHRGRRLVVPAGRATRPTSDRVREALFSSLESTTDLDGCRFADLFAGSGAVGLEALSRGAAHVLLVESDAKAARAARENIAALKVSATVRLVIDRDPPYDVPGERIDEMLEALAKSWLAPGAVVVIERSARGAEVGWPGGYRPLSGRRYGETMLWYARTDDV
jgi:16S rRNA (guanine966-N2)-methyltransferase